MMTLEEDGRFAEILDECCQRVRRGEPLDECLSDYPVEYRDELARLVPTAGRVSLLARDPSPEFQARLEQQLLTRVDEARQGERQGLLTRFGHFITALPVARVAGIVLVVLILLGGGGLGAVQASADSLPDSPLYQVKTAAERIQLALARTPEAQLDVRARQVAQRGAELEQAVQKGKQPMVVETVIARVETSTDQMVNQVLAARERGNPIPARRALVALRAVQRRLDTVIPRAQPNLRPALEELRGFFGQEEQKLLPARTVSPSFRNVQPRGLSRS